MTHAEPGYVVGDRSFGVVTGLVAGVRAEPADVEAQSLAGASRAAAFGKLDPRFWDETHRRGGDRPTAELDYLRTALTKIIAQLRD